ncbi:hypothetical protein [Pseudoalteromonas rubra]|uniref:hypothetical protein n=1 Tax=Pseudoalteromonas rubra TaxID=43658 RepID=UPI000F77D890|nr:hypothetical protein [Pseudoalteromonas rubra]
MSRLDGSGYTEIISGYSDLITQAVNKQGNLLIVYRRQQQVFSALIDLRDFKLLDKRALPKVGDQVSTR